jgi:AcrR family transcriptional regulator
MSTRGTETTKRRILEACRSVTEEFGTGQWKMEDVADRAGTTRMTVYRYFPSRTELLVATVRHVDETEQVQQRFASLGESATAIEALRRWVAVWADYMPRIHRLAQALLSARHIDEAAAKAWDDRMSYLRDGCRSIVDWLHRDGHLSTQLSVDDAADLMWAIVSIQVWDALNNERSWDQPRYVREVSRALKLVLTDNAPGRIAS